MNAEAMKNRKKYHAIGPFRRGWRLHFAKRIPGVCRVCGCTEDDPCYNPQYGYCWWSDDEMTLCSHCAGKDIALDPETVHCVNSEVL